jgi:prepilin-type N-terminal cleavage/methylation domain-containing protein
VIAERNPMRRDFLRAAARLHQKTSMTPRTICESAGFTLVEVLVAITLVASAGVALAYLVALGSRQAVGTREAFHALMAAQSKLEELRALTWSYSVPGSDIATSPAGTLAADTPGFVDRSPLFVTRWAILPRDPSDADVVVMHVCVFDAVTASEQAEACVSSVRTRKP